MVSPPSLYRSTLTRGADTPKEAGPVPLFGREDNTEALVELVEWSQTPCVMERGLAREHHVLAPAPCCSVWSSTSRVGVTQGLLGKADSGPASLSPE